MKKSRTALLLVLAGFILVLTGVFMGRNTTKNYVAMPEPGSPASVADGKIATPSEPVQPPRININTASKALLSQLPGIGDTLAQRIIDYREENGPFQDIADITNVPGIGQKRLDELRDYITTGG